MFAKTPTPRENASANYRRIEMKLMLSLSLLIIFLSTGCASLGTMTPPDISLVDLELTDVTVFETTGTITVRLTNENPDPLIVDGAVFKLFLNGIAVGQALDAERVEVPRLGTATQTVDLHINNVALVARLATMLEESEINYRIKSKLWVERPYGRRKVRLDHQGRFSYDEERGFESHLDSPNSLIEKEAAGGGSGGA
jgi:LEA14-like dessication related protein